jgi:hypothetical protein
LKRQRQQRIVATTALFGVAFARHAAERVSGLLGPARHAVATEALVAIFNTRDAVTSGVAQLHAAIPG